MIKKLSEKPTELDVFLSEERDRLGGGGGGGGK